MPEDQSCEAAAAVLDYLSRSREEQAIFTSQRHAAATAAAAMVASHTYAHSYENADAADGVDAQHTGAYALIISARTSPQRPTRAQRKP
jgi:hypothetical protein